MNQYTSTVARKFNQSGHLLQFPGNTIVLHLDSQHHIVKQLIHMQNMYKKLPFAHKFSYLPPQSFHMTIMGLITNQQLPEWNRQWQLNQDLNENDQYFDQILKKDKQLLKCKDIEMEVVGLYGDNDRLLIVQPTDNQTQKYLRRLHKHISSLTKCKISQNYGFHISMAYRIQKLTEQEEKEMKELDNKMNNQLRGKIVKFNGVAEFVVFEDMGQFVKYQGPETRKQLRIKRGYHH